MADETRNDPERDEPLSRVLQSWEPPGVPASLDERVLASYRRELGRTSLWRRLFTTSVRIPLPIAVAALLLFLLSAVMALRRTPLAQPTEPQRATTEENTLTARRADPPVVTRTSLAGFEPVAEINVTVVRQDVGR